MAVHCDSQPQRVALFRALQLGDLLVAAPALRALRARFGAAQITFIGLPWARELVARLPWVDDFMPFPGYPGLPEAGWDEAAFGAFVAAARARRFDLAIQLHGSGEITNRIVGMLGAGKVAGFHPAASRCPDAERFVAWPLRGAEAERLMRLARHLGAPHTGLHLEFPLNAGDYRALRGLWRDLGGHPGPYVCVHPGARLRSRRWPAERFAAVAAALAETGLRVVLTGSAGDADALRGFRAWTGLPFLDASARTGLGCLAALIGGARLLVCNDTGVSHIAAAVATPSVVISCGADPARFAPLDRKRHRVLYHDTVCRPCAYEICPFDHACAQGVPVAAVMEQARRLLDAELPRAA